MRIYLLFCFLITSVTASFAQQQAFISGDELLCPNTTGTAAVQSFVPYDSYQWQVKPDEDGAVFTNVAGATQSTFTYDYYNYVVHFIRCQVSQNGQTFYSNELYIEGLVFLPPFFSTDTEGDVEFNPNTGNYDICPGGSIISTMMNGGNVQWFKNNMAIPGATSASLTITEPGTYYASTSPAECPNSVSNSLPIVVVANPNCAPASDGPVIAGDTMLCPDAEGTSGIINNMAYDTYQWQVRDYNPGDEQEFTDIAGATEAGFTYGQVEYAVKEIRVKVTLDGETFYSNILLIDGHAWASLFVMHSIDGEAPETDSEGGMLICPGDEITNTVNSPYAVVQWYKDGEPIEGATETTYLITEPGEYYVVAAPDYCPESTSTSIPFYAVNDPNCVAGITNPDATAFTLYPNPAGATLNLSVANGTVLDSYTIIDVTGKTLLNGSLSGTAPSVNIQALAAGSYIIKVSSQGTQTSKMFIKQ